MYLYLVFYFSTEDGAVYMCDTKSPGKTVFTIHAHSKGVPALALSNHVPGCLATGSPDGSIKLWDLSNNHPTHLLTKDMKMVSALEVGGVVNHLVVTCSFLKKSHHSYRLIMSCDTSFKDLEVRLFRPSI